jgi:hypothetical protein
MAEGRGEAAMTEKNKDHRPPRRAGCAHPRPYFEAGQRVVCVDAPPNRLAPGLSPLLAGKIYVAEIDLNPGWKWPWWGVHLEGVRHLYLDGDALGTT